MKKIPAHQMNKPEREYRAQKIAERKLQAGLKVWPSAGDSGIKRGQNKNGYYWSVPCYVTVTAKEIEEFKNSPTE